MIKQTEQSEKGIIIIEANAKPKQHELFTARALADRGYSVRFIPSSTIISMADCYIDGVIFEIKAPEGRSVNCIERNLRKAFHHQSPNIVIDSFRMKNVQDRSIQNFLLTRLHLKHGLKRIFFVNRKREVVDINSLLR